MKCIFCFGLLATVPNMNKSIIILLLVFIQTTFAEDCQHLLESVTPTVEIHTMEGETTITRNMKNKNTKMEIFHAVDFRSGNAYLQIIDIEFDDSLKEVTRGGVFELRRVDGQDSMYVHNEQQDMPFIMSTIIDTMVAQRGPLPHDLELISCDGNVNYLESIQGEQVTFLSPKSYGMETEIQVIFSDGLPINIQIKNDVIEMLQTVNKYTVDENNIATYFETQNYMEFDGQAYPISESSTIVYSYNEPLKDFYFNP